MMAHRLRRRPRAGEDEFNADDATSIAAGVPAKSPRALCAAMAAAAPAPLAGRLCRRLENRFKPDDTPWWLVPSSEQPTFKFPKLRLAWADAGRGGVYVSLHLEKGLSPAVRAVYSSRKAARLIMDAGWAWRGLEGPAAAAIAAAAAAHPLRLGVEGGYVAEPDSFDPRREEMLGRDAYVFDCVPPGGLSVARSERKSFILKLHHVSSLDALLQELRKLSADDWLWLELHVGAVARTDGPEPSDAWIDSTSASLWRTALSPFVPLLSTAPPTPPG